MRTHAMYLRCSLSMLIDGSSSGAWLCRVSVTAETPATPSTAPTYLLGALSSRDATVKRTHSPRSRADPVTNTSRDARVCTKNAILSAGPGSSPAAMTSSRRWRSVCFVPATSSYSAPCGSRAARTQRRL